MLKKISIRLKIFENFGLANVSIFKRQGFENWPKLSKILQWNGHKKSTIQDVYLLFSVSES